MNPDLSTATPPTARLRRSVHLRHPDTGRLTCFELRTSWDELPRWALDRLRASGHLWGSDHGPDLTLAWCSIVEGDGGLRYCPSDAHRGRAARAAIRLVTTATVDGPRQDLDAILKEVADVLDEWTDPATLLVELTSLAATALFEHAAELGVEVEDATTQLGLAVARHFEDRP